jgi:hypothetical protein
MAIQEPICGQTNFKMGVVVNNYSLHFNINDLPSFVTWDSLANSFKIKIDNTELDVISSQRRDLKNSSTGAALVMKDVFNKVCDAVNTDHYKITVHDTLCAFIRI